MVALLKPTLACNMHCGYCYENPLRDALGSSAKQYDIDSVLNSADRVYQKDESIVLHGGEPLTMPKGDIEKALKYAYDKNDKSSIQTNGSLIDNDIIELFKKYNTSVGISFDGPEELNEARADLRLTRVIESNFWKVVNEGIWASVIIVGNKANLAPNRIDRLKDFMLELGKHRISGRLNPCAGSPEWELSMEDLKQAYLDIAGFLIEHELYWGPFRDIVGGLKGESRVCVFGQCDPFHTDAAVVVLGDGSVSNCMRTNQNGIVLRDKKKVPVRDYALLNSGYNGCKGCKYWSACYGGCSSEGIKGDWRNRTELCPLWYALFEYFEKMLKFCKVDMRGSKGINEHIDGGTRHLDSNAHIDDASTKQSKHSDIGHTEGNTRRLDNAAGNTTAKDPDNISKLNETGFTRVVPKQGCEHYIEKLDKMRSLAGTTEYEMVRRGKRAASTYHVKPEDMASVYEGLQDDGLVFTPIHKSGIYSGFAHRHKPVQNGEPWYWYGCITKNQEDGTRFKDADKMGDHETIGEMLGYPECCIRYFSENFSGNYDPVFIGYEGDVQGHPFCNPLLRYFGARITFHFPCSPQCSETIRVGQEWFDIMQDLDRELADELYELLNGPMEWSSLHGVVQVETPYFIGVTHSYPLDDKRVIGWNGQGNGNEYEVFAGGDYNIIKGTNRTW